MGIVSRRTRRRRKQIKRLLRRGGLTSGQRKRLRKERRGLQTATLQRGKLVAFGQLQRTDPKVAARLVSGEATTVQEAQKQVMFAERVTARTEENKARQRLIADKTIPQASTVPRQGGGTVTITKKGLVTERDANNQLIRRFNVNQRTSLDFLAGRRSLTQQRQSLSRTGGFPLGSKAAAKFEKLSAPEKKKVVENLIPTLSFAKAAAVQTKARAQQIRAGGELRAAKAPKTLAEKAERERQKQLTFIQRGRGGAGERIFRGVALLGLLGAARGVLGVVETIRSPIKTLKQQVQALRTPVQTLKLLGNQFIVDPVGTVVEFAVFGKTLGLTGRAVKKSPVGRFVQEELFIRAQPKQIQPSVRTIIKSSKIQERINPTKVGSIKKVDFLDVKSLSKIEATALKKTLQQTNSVLFGSKAARILAGKQVKKLPLPKDVDLATASLPKFFQKFKENLPAKQRADIKVRGEKIVRISNGEALFDLKPLNRLLPTRSILERRGALPVSGYVTTLKKIKGSVLPKFQRKPGITGFEIPTQKIVTVEGIRIVGFGEQTTRKGLGTLQVLIEKNVRRAKDPQAFLISLEVQIGGLKQSLKLAKSGRRKRSLRSKINKLSLAVRLLRSKAFARLLESKVPGLNKEFPLVAKISGVAIRKIRPRFVQEEVQKKLKRVIRVAVKPKKVVKKKPVPTKVKVIKKRKVKPSRLLKRKVKPSRLPKKRPSRLPSKLPRRKVSRLPSKLPKKKPSKLPSKFPVRKPSRLPRVSKLPRPSRLPGPSRLPRPSRLRVSRLPSKPSRLFKPKLPISPKKIPKLPDKTKQRLLDELVEKGLKEREFIYIPDLYSILFGAVATKGEKRAFLKVGRVFTGIEDRAIVKGVR